MKNPVVMKKNVACIGAGNIGRSWAIVFASAGCDVTVYDSAPTFSDGQFLTTVKKSTDALECSGLIESSDEVISRIHPVGSLREALQLAEYVQESVLEDVEIKREIFNEFDKLAPQGAILASSTSAIPASSFTENLRSRERALVVHPVNPPHLIPLVEICPAPWTSEQTVRESEQFMREVGQSPIILKQAVTGFVLNRLQFALFGEAMHLVSRGICTASDIDEVLTKGLALRWALYGPFEVMHLNASGGFRGFIRNLGNMIRNVTSETRSNYRWTDKLVETIHAEKCIKAPEKDILDHQMKRDSEIIALRKFLHQLRADNP